MAILICLASIFLVLKAYDTYLLHNAYKYFIQSFEDGYDDEPNQPVR